MVQDGTSVDAVRRFAAAVQEIRGQLLADLSPIADIADLLAAVRSRRELPRQGFTRSGIEYTVHGAGCQMTSSDGREVDLDLIIDPLLGREVEAFDAWRIRWFLDEAADDGYSRDHIVAACAHLAREGHLREVVEGHWFALPDTPGGSVGVAHTQQPAGRPS
ncbi:DUF6896 domain-containing protein [Micromonospora sp. LH3U1]|uniref:DUF6896 domain-containing protein n=1 Tax=Micromonospora sp. LH3U1 TaxID=3018339 RepID=UPI00234A8DB9|nr:hypothetical protein [Micromonospora sp. LH3U1]WCN79424.1 hypothetical protein PCA76_20650 [Micromonospora sp. LH3U1]